MTREPDFYKYIHQTKFRVYNTKKYQIFGVTIGNKKMTKTLQFYPEAPLIKYLQNSSNSCCLSIFHQPFTVMVTTGIFLPL